MNIGDTVALKSGSKVMTVEGIRSNGRVVCVWFNNRSEVHRASFPLQALKFIDFGQVSLPR